MSNDVSEMSENQEAAYWLREIAGAVPPGTNVETIIRGLAIKLRWSFSRTRDVWYQQARIIRVPEMRLLEKTAKARGQSGGNNEASLWDYARSIRIELDELKATLARIPS